MNNLFSRFYTVKAEIYKVTLTSGFESKYEKELLKTISCDIQVCSGSINDSICGITELTEIKLYCNADECVSTGNYVVIDGVSYIIVSVQKWNMGYVTQLKRRDLYGD